MGRNGYEVNSGVVKVNSLVRCSLSAVKQYSSVVGMGYLNYPFYWVSDTKNITGVDYAN